MSEIARYIYLWNDWIIFPALLIAALVAHLKYRKASTLLVASGIGLILIAQSLLHYFYSTPLHPAYVAALACYPIGLLMSVGGFVWFLRKDYRAQRNGI